MLRVIFNSVGIFRTSSLGDSILSNPERTTRSQGRSQVIQKFCNKGQVVWTSKDYYWLEKTRYPKLRNSVLFYVWEDARVWVHRRHSFDMHLSSLGPVTCVFHILSFPRTHHREWLQSDGCWMAGILSFLNSPRTHQLTIHGGCNCWWLWHPLSTDGAGNIPFLTIQCLFAVSLHGETGISLEPLL